LPTGRPLQLSRYLSTRSGGHIDVICHTVHSDPMQSRDTARRRAILDAALSCFLQYGFAKTSIDDIAKRANLSRPLLYLKYKNKEDIFGAVYDDVFNSRYPLAAQILAGRGS